MTPQKAWPARAATRERNREALLTAAAELLAHRGYADCSLNAIASKAGLSTGAVYSIFGSKAELFLELLRGQSRLPDFDEVTGACPDMRAALVGYGEHWAKLVNAPRARTMLELSFELQLAAIRDPNLLIKANAQQGEDVAALARQLQAASERRHEPLQVAAQELAGTLIAALQGLTEQAVLFGAPADVRLFGAVARRLLGP